VNTKALFVAVAVCLFWLPGCAGDKTGDSHKSTTFFQQTIPNGSSPAKANAPHAPMNDTPEMRSAWNHGNGVLWVMLQFGGYTWTDGTQQKDGSLRMKFGWWRGVSGHFSIEGHRLDGQAPPLRYQIEEKSYGDLGFIPSDLIFPTEGYWQITGHIGGKSLTFVIHVFKTP
jgi:hypothetical protein